MILFQIFPGKRQFLSLTIRIVTFIALLLSILIPTANAQAQDSTPPNPFFECDCVNLGYTSAPISIQRLISWSLGLQIDDSPASPNEWVNWSATWWPENIKRFGPLMDSCLNWDAAIDATPEVGALVVWSGNSTVTWSVDGIPYAYTHGPAGHIAVVTAYDPNANVISVQEKNWAICDPPERHDIDVSSGMIFIHNPLPFDSIPATEETVMTVNRSAEDPTPTPTRLNNAHHPGQVKHTRDLEQE